MSVGDARVYTCTCTVHDKLSCTRLQNYTIGASLKSVSVSVSVPWNLSLYAVVVYVCVCVCVCGSVARRYIVIKTSKLIGSRKQRHTIAPSKTAELSTSLAVN